MCNGKQRYNKCGRRSASANAWKSPFPMKVHRKTTRCAFGTEHLPHTCARMVIFTLVEGRNFAEIISNWTNMVCYYIDLDRKVTFPPSTCERRPWHERQLQTEAHLTITYMPRVCAAKMKLIKSSSVPKCGFISYKSFIQYLRAKCTVRSHRHTKPAVVRYPWYPPGVLRTIGEIHTASKPIPAT